MKACKTLLTALLGISCIFTGCAKKPKPPMQNAVVPSTTSQTVKKDSGDIFNEFYNDSAVALDKVKNIKTFSLKPSKNPPTAAAAPESTPGLYIPAFSDNGRFVVQIASMGSRVLADELALEFKEKGYPSYVVEVQNPTPALTGTYYRVRIGAFATSVDAKAFSENILVPLHFDYWVDRKTNESSAPLESQLDPGTSYTPWTPSSSTYSPPNPPASPPPRPKTYESTIIPGPGTFPPATSGQTPVPSSTGGWSDSSAKW
jgi:hypothetical protein